MAEVSSLLARIIEDPKLPERIQALAPAQLGKMIDLVGLEDAGEIVAFATTEQLAHVFDEDLWKNQRPGEEETFDAERFAVWLEVMLEAGDAFVAQRLAELPEELVTLAFHKHLIVIAIDDLRSILDELDDDDVRQTEKALENCIYEEIDAYQLIARNHASWDSVLTAVLALDRDHRALLERILDRCQAMSREAIDNGGGLYEVLTSEEMLEQDVAGTREDRRAEAGHVEPRAARAFLELARKGNATERDSITRAYFRDVRDVAPPAIATPLSDLVDSVTPKRRRLGTGAPDALLSRAMQTLDAKTFADRAAELAYLANVLLAGATFEGRRLRPIEATRAAIAIVSQGLEHEGIAAIRDTPLDLMFRRVYSRVGNETHDFTKI